MRLVRVRLRNFRCYKDDTAIKIDDLTTIVGRGDCGKSTILEALAIFFEDTVPDADDASVGGDKLDVRIICEFDDLPPALVIDADFPTNLKDEYLLNDRGHLEIHKVYNCTLKKPKLEVFARAVHPSSKGFQDLLQLKISDLKKRANELSVDISGIDAKIKSAIRRCIWDSEKPQLSLDLREVPLQSEDAGKIWDQLKKKMPTYALFKSDRPSTDQDAEAQDPMKAAVKEALKTKENELDEISQHVEREVKAIAAQTVAKLREMNPDLAKELNPQFTQPTWANVFKISLTGDEDIPLNKRGSGVRRLVLLNFFRAKAERLASERQSGGVIYAVEEPETSQHPDSQRMLLHAFSELAEQPNCQVLISTHTPMLGRLLPVHTLRYIEWCTDGSRKVHSGDENTNHYVAKALGVLTDHDVRLFIGIEGTNDINFLKTISRILSSAGESVPDLHALEDAGKLIFIPLGGSTLVHWKSRLENLNVPEFYLLDRDAEPPAESPHQSDVDDLNVRDACTARLTNKSEMENYLHPDAIKAARPAVEISFGDFDDVPALAAKAVHDASGTAAAWDDLDEKKQKQKMSQAKKWLNKEASASMTPELLTASDPHGDIRGWLNEIMQLVQQS